MKKKHKRHVQWKGMLAILFVAAMIFQSMPLSSSVVVAAAEMDVEEKTQISSGKEKKADNASSEEVKKEQTNSADSKEKAADSDVSKDTEDTSASKDSRDTESSKDSEESKDASKNSGDEDTSKSTGSSDAPEGKKEDSAAESRSDGNTSSKNGDTGSDTAGTDDTKSDAASAGDSENSGNAGSDETKKNDNASSGEEITSDDTKKDVRGASENNSQGDTTPSTTNGENNQTPLTNEEGGTSGDKDQETTQTNQKDETNDKQSGNEKKDGEEGGTETPDQPENPAVTFEGYKLSDESSYAHKDSKSVITDKALSFKYVPSVEDAWLEYRQVESTDADEKENPYGTFHKDDITSDGEYVISYDNKETVNEYIQVKAVLEVKQGEETVRLESEKIHTFHVMIDTEIPTIQDIEITPENQSLSYDKAVNGSATITAEMEDDLECSYQYVIVDEKLTNEKLSKLEDSKWNDYKTGIVLEDGKGYVYLKAKDAVHDPVYALATEDGFFIDMTPPEVTIEEDDTTKGKGTPTHSLKLSCEDPEGNGTFSGLASYSYELKDSDGNTVDLYTVKDKAFEAEESQNLSFVVEMKDLTGVYTFSVIIKDVSGNTSLEKTIKLTFDNDGPKAVFSAPVETGKIKDKDDHYHFTTKDFLNNEETTVTFTKDTTRGNKLENAAVKLFMKEENKTIDIPVEISKENPGSVEISLASSREVQTALDTNGNLGDGTWDVLVYAKDTNGLELGTNDKYAKLYTAVIDDTAPVPTLVSDPEGLIPLPATETKSSTIKETEKEKVYYNGNVTVSAKIDAKNEQDSGLLVWNIEGGTTTDISDSADNSIATGQLAATAGIVQALPELKFTVTDLAGNAGTVVFKNTGDDEKYYFDREAPVITYTAAKGKDFSIVENSGSVEYSVKITDSGCGVNAQSVRYAVIYDAGNVEAKPADADWKTPTKVNKVENKDTYTFDITAPARGLVYIQASDNLGNGPSEVTANTLVIEQEPPVINSITVKADRANGEETTIFTNDTNKIEVPANDFAITVSAGDQPEEKFSGLKYVKYALTAKGSDSAAAIKKTILFNKDVKETPKSIEELVQAGDSTESELSGLFGKGLDGEFELAVSVIDFCGNESAAKTIAIEFDNSAPEIKISMNGGAVSKYPSIYKADNCEVIVEITEKNIKDYVINVGKKKVDFSGSKKPDNGVETVNILAKDIVAENSDSSSVKITVSVTDDTGNETSVFSIADSTRVVPGTKADDDAGLYNDASFTLDTMSPAVSKITVFADDAEVDHKKEVWYDDTKAAYFNSNAVKVEYTIDDTNYDQEMINGAALEKDGAAGTTTLAKKNNTVSATFSEEGLYKKLAIGGTDMAGNPLILARSDSAKAIRCTEATETTNGTVELFNGIIVDRSGPEITISYTLEDNAKKAFLYSESLTGGRTPNITAYFNGNVMPEIQLKEKNLLDDARLFVNEHTGTNQISSVTKKTFTANGTDKWKADNIESLTTDGDWAFFSVHGTDRAGNTVVIAEDAIQPADRTEDPEAKGLGNAASEDDRKKISGNVYTSPYLFVIDKTNPSASVSYTLEDNGKKAYLYSESLAGGRTPNITAYFNGNVTPEIQLEEKNLLDDDRLFVNEHTGTNQISSVTKKTFAANGTDKWKADNIESLTTDGDWAFFSVHGTDRAGNTVVITGDAIQPADRTEDPEAKGLGNAASEVDRKKISGNVYTSLFLFVIDKTAPEVTIEYSPAEGETAYIYADKDESGKKGETDLYAFVKKPLTVKATITNKDEHIDPKRISYADKDTNNDGDKWEKKGYLEQTSSNNKSIILREADSNNADGFEYRVWGVDKAGNIVNVTEQFANGTVSNPTNIEPSKLENRAAHNNTYTPLYTIMYDDIVPELTMEYTQTPKSGRSAVYAFVYDEAGDKKETAYVSGENAVTVALSEDYFDTKRLFYVQTLDGNDSVSGGKGAAWDSKSGAWDAANKKLTLDTATKDGVYTSSVFGEDRAGNPATVIEQFADPGVLVSMNKALAKSVYITNNCGAGYDQYYTFVIDKTSPVLTKVETIRIEEKENAEVSAAVPQYYTDDSTYYYNEEYGIRTIYTVVEHNFDAKRFKDVYTVDGLKAEKKNTWTDSDDTHTYGISFVTDGTYENVLLIGVDKAGNPIVLNNGKEWEDWQNKGEYNYKANQDTAEQQNAVHLNIEKEGTKDGQDGIDYKYEYTEVQLARTRILDRVSPVLEITHVVPDNTTGYLYPAEESDKVVSNDATMYSKNIVTTKVQVSDTYGKGKEAKEQTPVLLDGQKLTVRRSFRISGGTFAVTDIEQWAKHPSSKDPLTTEVQTTKEGHYAFTVLGTDRAGNPVIVKEKLQTNKDKKAVTNKDKGKYDGDMTKEETTKAGATYRSLFVLVYDFTAPVYRFTINNPANLAETFDEAAKIAYYGKSVSSINAKFVVTEDNFDDTRILSGTTYLSDSGVRNVNELAPDWVKPDKNCTASSEKNGMTTATFYMPVAVNEQNEGSWRFEIEGCDKAGNFLTQNDAQKTVDSSTKRADLASKTAERGSGSGRFWSERKVVDVTAPTGALKIRKNKDDSDNYYELKFEAGSNNPEKYDPFKKETSAYVVVESQDKSPTYISYNLRSQDTRKDSSYQNDNPLVSKGNDGYDNGNSRGTVVNGEQAFYVEKVLIKDRAGNVRANDKASEYTLAKSNCIYLDVTNPVVSKIQDAESPQVKIVASGSFTRHEADGERYIYKPDGSALDLKVSITDPGGKERSSGLKKVTTKVWVGSNDVTDRVSISNDLKYEYSVPKDANQKGHPNLRFDVTESEGHISIPSGSFAESNDIRIEVVAEDNSGNISTPSKDGGQLYLGIDTTAPRVEVNYRDGAQPEHDKYFKADRVVEIVVIDRNVDNSKINIQTNTGVPGSFTVPHGNKTTDGNGELGNDDRWIKTLNYDQDGDYTLQISGTDALGNRISDIKWNGPAPNEFTVDKTRPVIRINLPEAVNEKDGVKYYDKETTATVEIVEHNFFEESDKSKLDVTTEVSNRGDDEQAPTPGRSGFSTGGSDIHRSTIDCEKDGDYEVSAFYIDMAGNEAVVEGGEGRKSDTTAWSGKYVVDLKDPTIKLDPETFNLDNAGNPVEGLANQIYTSKDFAPRVNIQDTNYDEANSRFEVDVFGADTGKEPLYEKKDNDLKGTHDIQFVKFDVKQEMDGVYRVTAIAVDLAKRQTSLDFMFSINRFGSTYMYADEPTEDKVDRYYINNTEEPLKILEITPVELKTHKVELFKDSDRKNLTESGDYSFSIASTGTKGGTSREGHRVYEYDIDSAVYEEEGVYDFVISSTDVGGNDNSTTVYRDGTVDGAKIIRKKFPIEFQVDKTLPTNRITGVDADKERFSLDQLDITLYPEDYQTDIKEVEVRIWTGSENGADAEEDTAKYQHYRYFSEEDRKKEDALRQEHIYPIEEAKDGIPVTLEGKNGLRSWQLLEVITTDLAGNISTDYRVGDERVSLPETRRKFLVTTNPVIQYYYNRPLFFGSIGGVGLLFLLFLFWKRRKEEEDDEEAA